jgi:hypothetical protein
MTDLSARHVPKHDRDCLGVTVVLVPGRKFQLTPVWLAESPYKQHNMSLTHCSMPATYRSMETISPASLKRSLNLNHLRLKEVGEALGNYLAMLQACIRPWQREAPPEEKDHG